MTDLLSHTKISSHTSTHTHTTSGSSIQNRCSFASRKHTSLFHTQTTLMLSLVTHTYVTQPDSCTHQIYDNILSLVKATLCGSQQTLILSCVHWCVDILVYSIQPTLLYTHCCLCYLYTHPSCLYLTSVPDSGGVLFSSRFRCIQPTHTTTNKQSTSQVTHVSDHSYLWI